MDGFRSFSLHFDRLIIFCSYRDMTSPLFGVTTHVTGIQALFYIQSVIYLLLVLGFFADIFFAWGSIQSKPQLKFQIIYFTGPSLVVISSVLIGIILGVVGPFARESTAAVYYLTMHNLFVLFMLWAYWPIQKTLNGGGTSTNSDASESTSIFPAAIEKKGYETL